MNNINSSVITPQEFIDKAGIKPRHWLVFAVITLVLMADGMDITVVSHVFPSLVKEWEATRAQITFIVTVSFIGMGIGALLGGRLADRFGRKNLTVLALVLLGVTTVLVSTAASMEMFIFWRIVSSLGLGAVMPVILTLLADLAPSANRAQLVAIVSAGIGLGTTCGAFLAGFIIPSSGWRTLMVICGIIPLVLILPFIALVPESPAWLAARGSVTKAKRAMEKLLPGSVSSTVQFAAPAAVQKSKGTFRIILSRRFLSTTGSIWTFAFIGLGVQMTIVQYLPTLLQSPVPGLTTSQSSLVVGLYGAASTVGNILLGMILRKYSRFIVVGTFLVLSIGCLVLIGTNPTMDFPLIVMMMSLTGLVLPTVMGGTQNIFAVIAYPAQVRATGVGSASLAGRVGSVAGGITGGTLLGAGLGLSGFFLVLALPVTIMVGVVGAMSITARRHDADGSEEGPGAGEGSLHADKPTTDLALKHPVMPA